MRILHLTHCLEWFKDHFDYICQQTGHTGETQHISDFGLTEEKANALWAQHKDYYESFDAIFVSHLATLSRIFLQNNWKKPLYIWLCFRFDHFDPTTGTDKRAYQNLIKEARLKPNVKFRAAAEHDRLHIQRVLGEFPVDTVPPFVYINNEGKVRIPCDDKLFVVSKHNETIFMNLKAKMDELHIPAYKHRWQDGAPDLRGVLGVLHIPYTFLTRGLMENLALENVFFLPSLEFFNTLRQKNYFFWDVQGPSDVHLSEWYRDMNRHLFVYFQSFEHLKQIMDSPNLGTLLKIKKQDIRMFNKIHNEVALSGWKEFLS